jgi:hypothetical protein
MAAALLPVGGYCLATAWRNNRAYLPLALIPALFGLQQLCEARLWVVLNRNAPDLARGPSLAFLFFALALWPVWIPLAAAAVEPPGRKRLVLFIIGVCGFAVGLVYYVPAASNNGLSPTVVGHSIRYDFSAVPALQSAWWWVWPVAYIAAVCVPPMVSHNRSLRPIGVAVVILAMITYALFAYAFASVWCFFAAILSVYLAHVLRRLPEQTDPSGPGTLDTPGR